MPGRVHYFDRIDHLGFTPENAKTGFTVYDNVVALVSRSAVGGVPSVCRWVGTCALLLSLLYGMSLVPTRRIHEYVRIDA